MSFIFAQILGIIALIILSIGYFLKNRSRFLFVQIIANLFYALAFLVLKAYVAGIITLVSLIRCLYLYIADKKNFKHTLLFLPIFICLYILITGIFWKNNYDIIPLITAVIFTFAFSIKNLQLSKYILIVPNLMLVVYNILTTTYASALLDFVEVAVIVVAIVKYHLNNNNCK